MMSFENKVVFVTGAASGLGLALSESFAKEGSLVMMADNNPEPLAKAQKRIAKINPQTTSIVCDVSDRHSLEAAALATKTQLGDVSILVNNAGVGIGGGPGLVSPEQWKTAIDINILGPVFGVDIFLDMLRQQEGGAHIVNTGSMAAFIPSEGMLPYGATKHAIVGYSESLSLALASDGIGVSVLCPGFVKTNILSTSQRYSEGVAPNPQQAAAMTALLEGGLAADVVAELTLDSIRKNRMYIFTDALLHEQVKQKQKKMDQDCMACLAFLAATSGG